MKRSCIDAASPTLRTIVVRPGVVYGNSGGMVGDLLKMASNGLVRVVGDGNNHWPLVYDRDLADLYARLVASTDASGIYHANDEGDERVNDLIAAIKPHVAHKPDVRYVPIEEARRSSVGCRCDGARSGGQEPPRPRARVDADVAVGGRARRAAARRVAQRRRLIPEFFQIFFAAPGNKSKNASRLRSIARRSCGIAHRSCCSVTPPVVPSASVSDASLKSFSVPSGTSLTP